MVQFKKDNAQGYGATEPAEVTLDVAHITGAELAAGGGGGGGTANMPPSSSHSRLPRLAEPLLVAAFGSAAWLNVNAAWMQLPLMVAELPEMWSLPSYLALIIQVSCVVPLVYGLCKKFVKRLEHADATYGIAAMCGAFVALSAVLAVCWHRTAVVFGERHSVALFIVFFLLSSVCTSTNVVWLPHLSRWRPELLGPFFVGLGVGALVPSFVGLIQGAGVIECLNATVVNGSGYSLVGQFQQSLVPPNFSVGVYYVIMAGWQALALAAFLVLAVHYARYARAASSDDGGGNSADERNRTNNALSTSSSSSDMEPRASTPLNDASNGGGQKLSLCAYICALAVTGWVCGFMNAILPSIMVYSCLPYGQSTYHWALILSNVANPIGCYLPSVAPLRKVSQLCAAALAATVFCAYVIALAAMSPLPIGVGYTWGAALSVLAATFAMLLLAYARTCAASVLRSAAGDSEPRLFWCGASTQIGSFAAAMLIFPLINVYGVFRTADVCPLPEGFEIPGH